MRGFLAGSFALIVLYVAVQPGSAAKAQTGSNLLIGLFRRALSPDVAAVRNRGASAAAVGQAAKNLFQQPAANVPTYPATIAV